MVIKIADGKITVTLPDGTVIDYADRTTVTVSDKDNAPVKNMPVNVKDSNGGDRTGTTDANGKVVVPPLSEDMTDKDGNAQIKDSEGNLYNINVATETKGNIEDAEVKIADGKITVTLPDGTIIDYADRTTVTVTDKDNAPVKDMSVNVKGSNGGDRTETTDASGKVIVPPLNEGRTDGEGNTEVQDPTKPGDDSTSKKNVTVTDEKGNIVDADVVIDPETGDVHVQLPSGTPLDPKNRVIVTVSDGEGKPCEGVSVTVADSEGNTASGKTDKDGKAAVPEKNKDVTDSDGKGDVTDTDKEGVDKKYNVKVSDTLGNISDANIEIADGKITVALPSDKTLNASNQTTVTVTDQDDKPVSGVGVTVKDATTSASATTNSAGQVVLPVKYSSGGGGGSSSGGSSGGGGSVTVTTTYNVKVTDKDGKAVNVTKSVKDGKITLTLPNGKTLDGDDYYTIVVTDKNGKAAPDIDVTLKDKNGNSANGVTDTNGKLILPATEHKAYIVGYEDGTFKPEGNMTRAEAAAIFARNIADRKGETIPHKNSSFKDVNPKLWYNDTIAYLEKYGVIAGYTDGTFKPDGLITRAEFVTMCSRFYKLTDKITAATASTFTDVKTGHWAYQYIIDAAAMDWIAGYADNTFRPDAQIKRAEVVAIVNRMTGRKADRDFVNANMSKINPFTDMNDSVYWAFYDVIEAANTHMAGDKANGETWVN